MVYGSPTSPKSPIVVISAGVVAIHACRVPPDRANGKPEEKPRKAIQAIFLL